MNAKRIKEFTPIHPKKATFFKSLLTFFETTEMNTLIEQMSNKQKEITMVLKAFDENGTHIPKFDVSKVSVLNADVVKQMRPTMHGKVALYDALIAFFDATLAIEKEHEENCHFNNDKDDNFLAIALNAMPSFIGVSIISPIVKKNYEEKKAEVEKQNKKKHYYVNVHFDAVVGVEIDAFNENEAMKLAKEIADFSNYEIEGVKCCITDVEE